ncbi:YciI family protein [Fretibacter rubidus]|uniref:YciI family protein n=1 Tax=Fretibacter rubidus TaxID=570162 RepID=UPI00352A0448
MQFMIYSEDVTDGLPIRQATREAHLNWLKSDAAVSVQVAGPWMDDDGTMRGSLLIVDCQDRVTLDAWMARDPYKIAGLPGQIIVRAYKVAINNL